MKTNQQIVVPLVVVVVVLMLLAIMSVISLVIFHKLQRSSNRYVS